MLNRNYLIVGATGSIGSAVSRLAVERGARILISGRRADRLRKLSAELDVPQLELDASDSEQVQSAFDQANQILGGVDGVVNCAGSLLLKPAHLTTDDEWARTLQTNLTSAFNMVRHGAKAMLRSGGAIVLISSAAAKVGLANHEAIAAAKAGIVGLTLSAAATYAQNNIRVNAVAPGLVKTELTTRLTSTPAAERVSTQMHPLGRLGEPSDIAKMIVWLLDPEHDWITGEVFSVDGGLAHVRTRMKA